MIVGLATTSQSDTPLVFNHAQTPLSAIPHQQLPVGSPISILDGGPSLVVKNVYEHPYSRKKHVNVYIDIPYRETHKIDLVFRGQHGAESSTFEYRDKMYKITANHIDLQEQIATLSLVKLKDIK